MSESLGISFGRIAAISIGIVMALIGGLITFYAATATGSPSPIVITPVGIIVVVFGVILAMSKGD